MKFSPVALLLGSLVALAPSVSDAYYEYECAKVSWRGDHEAAEMLTERGADGWQLVSFLKGSMPCFRRRTSSDRFSYRCLSFRWKDGGDLSAFVQREAAQGWHFAGSSRPSQLCFEKGLASSSPRSAPPAATAVPSDGARALPAPAAGTATPAPRKGKAKPRTPEDGVRDRAEKSHKDLKKEEDKR